MKIGERVTVTAMLDDDEAGDSLGEMQVEIEWQGWTLGVPLAQLITPIQSRRKNLHF